MQTERLPHMRGRTASEVNIMLNVSVCCSTGSVRSTYMLYNASSK
jgi:hypothetical protein